MRALRPCAIVRGANEVASAVAIRLVEAGYTVLLADGPVPAVARRGVSFADAARDGEACLEDLRCRRVGDAAEWLRGGAHDIAYCSQALGTLLAVVDPEVLVDARLPGRSPVEDLRGLAPRVIGLGPHFIAGGNCDLAVDAARGDGPAEHPARIAAGVQAAILRLGGLPPLARAAVAGVLRNALGGELDLFATTLGFDRREFHALAVACLPDAELDLEWQTGAHALCASQAPALFMPLANLLLAYRAPDLDEHPARWLAHALAAAGFGARHLWQDLGLSGRPEVSRLMRLCFPGLAAHNTTDLKWKRFLFLTLGSQLGRPGLMPPNCDGCASHAACLGAALPDGRTDGRSPSAASSPGMAGQRGLAA